MKNIRKIIEIDEELCDGCGLCVPDCAEGSLIIVDGKAKLVEDKLCDGLGACLGACPTGALKIIEREADDFDEEAVEEYLQKLKEEKQEPSPLPQKAECGCPSAKIQTFSPQNSLQKAISSSPASGTSTLSHWPVQIRLIPATAPFLKGSDIAVVADCTAVTAPGFQERYLQDKVVMMGCPKFDDAESYIQKFREILLTADIQSITILIMEVPCCSAMNTIIKEAIEKSGVQVKVEEITISTRGEELQKTTW